MYLKNSTWPPWYDEIAMPCASSWIAQLTISSTERLWPRWITSQPVACRMRRMMLIDASWPSNSDAAVTKRTLLTRLVDERRTARIVHGALLRAGGAWRRREWESLPLCPAPSRPGHRSMTFT